MPLMARARRAMSPKVAARRKRFDAARKQSGLTMADIAERCDVAMGYLFAALSGTREAHALWLTLAEVLRVDAAWLLGKKVSRLDPVPVAVKRVPSTPNHLLRLGEPQGSGLGLGTVAIGVPTLTIPGIELSQLIGSVGPTSDWDDRAPVSLPNWCSPGMAFITVASSDPEIGSDRRKVNGISGSGSPFPPGAILAVGPDRLASLADEPIPSLSLVVIRMQRGKTALGVWYHDVRHEVATVHGPMNPFAVVWSGAPRRLRGLRQILGVMPPLPTVNEGVPRPARPTRRKPGRRAP